MSELIINLTNSQNPRIICQTRQGNEINNEQVVHCLPLSVMAKARDIKRIYNFAIYRTMPCGYYNCHGLVFASRRTQIWETEEVKKIILEDNYKIIEEKSLLIGDVVIYYSNGDAIHSGIIVAIETLSKSKYIKVLSKWGKAHEVIHLLRDCPYSEDADLIKYYRVESVKHGDIQ